MSLVIVVRLADHWVRRAEERREDGTQLAGDRVLLLAVINRLAVDDGAGGGHLGGETARDANVSFIIDTNFGTSPDPRKYALQHVRAVVQHPGLLEFVSGVEIGNEMDLYFHEKPGRAVHRNKSYTEEEYEVEFGNFVETFIKEGGLQQS